MSNVAKVERNYGIERSIGEVIYNPATKVVVANVNGGIFGKLSLTLKKDDAGGFDLLKPYKDRSGNEQVVKLGKLFPVKDRQGALVDGLHKGTLPLLKQWDAELQKRLIRQKIASSSQPISSKKMKQWAIVDGSRLAILQDNTGLRRKMFQLKTNPIIAVTIFQISILTMMKYRFKI